MLIQESERERGGGKVDNNVNCTYETKGFRSNLYFFFSITTMPLVHKQVITSGRKVHLEALNTGGLPWGLNCRFILQFKYGWPYLKALRSILPSNVKCFKCFPRIKKVQAKKEGVIWRNAKLDVYNNIAAMIIVRQPLSIFYLKDEWKYSHFFSFIVGLPIVWIESDRSTRVMNYFIQFPVDLACLILNSAKFVIPSFFKDKLGVNLLK